MKIIHQARFLMAIGCLLAVLATGCSAGMKKSYHLRRANNYFAAGQYEPAEIEYLNVIRNDPENFQAISRLGEIYFDQGRMQSASQFLYRARQLNTNDVVVRAKLGKLYQSAGKPKDARDEAGFVLDHEPQNPEVPMIFAETSFTPQEIASARQRLNSLPPTANQAVVQVALGILSLHEKDFKSADASFQRAQNLDPKCAVAWSAMGILYQQQTNFVQAEAAFKTAADLAPARSSIRLNYANFEIQSGHPDIADAFLKNITTTSPDLVSAWVLRAEIAMAATNYNDCATYLAAVQSRDPDNFDMVLLNIQLDLVRGNTAKARLQLERMAHQYSQIPRIHYLLALTCLANNEVNAAIISLDRALTLQTNFTDASLLLSQVLIKNNTPDQAVGLLRRVLDQEPGRQQASLLLADAYRAKKIPAEALKIYAQLDQKQAPSAGVLLLEGFTYLEMQDQVSARKAFARALELAPNNLRVIDALVQLDLSEKKYDDALQMLEKVLANNPPKAEFYLLESRVFEARGDTSRAVEVLKKAINVSPDSPSAHLILAQLYIKIQNPKLALEELETILQKTPQVSVAQLLKGQVLTGEKNYAAAAAAFEQVLSIDPQSSAALNNLAYLYSEYLGQSDKAWQFAKKARDLLPNDPATADTLGWVLFHRGDYVSALTLLQESAHRLTSVPEVQYHLGKANYMLDQEEAATTNLQRALQLNPAFEWQEDCKRCLNFLAMDPAQISPAMQATLEKRIAETPDDTVVLMRLAGAYKKSGNMEKTIQMYESILNASPSDVPAMLELARFYSTNNLPKAFEIAKNAYKVAPQNSDVAAVLGRLAFQSGNFKWAFSLLKTAAKDQTDNGAIQFDLGRVAYSNGKIAEARASFQSALNLGLPASLLVQAKQSMEMIDAIGQPAITEATSSRSKAILQNDPNDVPALMVNGMAWEQKSDFDSAGQAYESVLKLYPDFAPAQKKLALVYVRNNKRIQEAYALVLKARQVYADDSELTKLMGIILYLQGDNQQALGYFKLCSSDRPNDAELYYYQGLVQYRLKNMTDCRVSFHRALDLKLSPNQATEAQRILQSLK